MVWMWRREGEGTGERRRRKNMPIVFGSSSFGPAKGRKGDCAPTKAERTKKVDVGQGGEKKGEEGIGGS